MVSDCHIHLGRNPSIKRETIINDIMNLTLDHHLDKILVMGTEIDHDINQLALLLDIIGTGGYGLQWLDDDTKCPSLDEKIIGCKFHGAYSYHPKPSISILEELDNKKSVLMMHTGRYKDGNIQSNTSYLHSKEIAEDYPNIKLIMAHMGGTDTNICKSALNDCVELPNVYFDTSGITTPYIVEYAVETVGSKRIMFGSDVPWCSWRAMYNTVMDARISEEDMRNILKYSFEGLL